MKQPTYTPSYFPGEEVQLKLTGDKRLVTKIGIDGNGTIDYLLWDGNNYSWTDYYLIEPIQERTIGFNVKNNNGATSNK